ncbi:uncharacterized protein METZ01_LOCUS125258 [marine metagenome]|uniref:Uncharacterized protein n=1 Tax=marine metagenome TaxID=408172 RepID=A0A381Y5V9_9ZZZZ
MVFFYPEPVAGAFEFFNSSYSILFSANINF